MTSIDKFFLRENIIFHKWMFPKFKLYGKQIGLTAGWEISYKKDPNVINAKSILKNSSKMSESFL